mgnify:CR=1 FL=1
MHKTADPSPGKTDPLPTAALLQGHPWCLLLLADWLSGLVEPLGRGYTMGTSVFDGAGTAVQVQMGPLSQH